MNEQDKLWDLFYLFKDYCSRGQPYTFHSLKFYDDLSGALLDDNNKMVFDWEDIDEAIELFEDELNS